jgi:hypothetical protein
MEHVKQKHRQYFHLKYFYFKYLAVNMDVKSYK